MNRPDTALQCGRIVSDPTGFRRIGDWLLHFGEPRTDYTGRGGAAWDVMARAREWHVAIQPPAPAWRGFPLLRMATDIWQAWLLGELYGVADVPRVLETFFERPESGDAATLNGHFLLWAWNSQADQWHVWTNRFGTLHAYYGDAGKSRAIGTFSPAVASAASRRELDWRGLSGWCAFGYFPGDRTHFKDVRILRPAHEYVFDATGNLIRQHRYWQWFHQPDGRRTYDDTVDDFGHLFQQVMDEHLRHGATAIPVSGGLDSRSTVAAVNETSNRLWAYSYGYTPHSVETRIAKQVAAARYLRFQSFTVDAYLFRQLPLILAWTEGFQDVTQCRQVVAVDEIGRQADQLIAALWGDVWFDDMGLYQGHSDDRPRTDVVAHTLRRIEKGGRNWLLDHLISPRIARSDGTSHLRADVADEFRHLGHVDDLDFRVKAYKTDQWSFRWSLPPVRVFQSAAWPRPIFYDTRLTDFFCTVPTSYVAGRQLQIDFLKRFAPDLARIRWQASGANLYHDHRVHMWLWPKRILSRVWRLATRRRVIERNWEVQFLGAEGRQQLSAWLLRPGLRLHEFVAPGAIQDLLDGFFSQPLSPAKPGYTVSMLLTFSAWLEQYG